MKKLSAGGGWPAIWYALRKSREAGGLWRMFRALRTRNACKTCALGMGGQLGGMVNETGHFPEVCKKSIQAMAADMQGEIREHFFDDFNLEKLRGFTPRELEAAGRLVEPVCAGPLDGNYRPIGWDDALARIATKLKKTAPDETFFYFSGRSSNEAGYLMQLFARLYGTNNVNNCSYYCHQASGVALSTVTGSGTATVTLDDIDLLGKNDVLFIIGANPASNHPRLMSAIVSLKRRGAKVIVINPLRELGLVRFKVPSDVRSLLWGSVIADMYVQPHIGGDIALLTGIAKAVIERNAVDERFVRDHADGWDGVRSHIASVPWDRIVHDSGVEQAVIRRIAECYIAAGKAIFCWAMGMTHHEHGVANVQMIANLAMMRGMLGRPGAGLLPLRGHSNVQGIGSMGVVPRLKDSIHRKMEHYFQIKLPTSEGLDTLAAVQRAEEGRIRFALCTGGNLFGSNPDADFASRAMANVDMVVYLSTTLNTGHVCGRGRETIILPVLARDEEEQATTQESMFSYVRLSDGGTSRHGGPRSEVDIIAAIARLVLGDSTPIDWNSIRRHERIRAAIAATISGYEAIGAIDQTKQEFHISGRVFREPQFATDNGRAKFHVVDLPPIKAGDNGALRLMTVRSEGQFNTVVYENEDIYRGQERRDVVMMNPADIQRLGLRADQRVTVRSRTGSLARVLVREIDIRAGNAAMYYPEANVLIPRDADPRSRTPAFKSAVVTIEPDPDGIDGSVAEERKNLPAGAAPRRGLKAC